MVGQRAPHAYESFCALVLAACGAATYGQSYKVIYNFGSQSGDPTGPRYTGTISQSPGGNLLCSADDHWTTSLGSAFEMGIAGKLTILHAFSGGADGKAPVGGLILGTDQRFHGTTEFGGLHNRGTIFRLAPDGTFKTLYDFTGAD